MKKFKLSQSLTFTLITLLTSTGFSIGEQSIPGPLAPPQKLDSKIVRAFRADPNLRGIEIVIFFKSPQGFQRVGGSLATYQQARKNLVDRAIKSQKRVYNYLKQFTASPEVKIRQLWVANVIAARLPKEALQGLEKFPEILFVQSNLPVSSSRGMNGSYMARAPKKLGTPSGVEYTGGLAAIGIPQLRAKLPQLRGNGVIAGIIDGGFDMSHPQLQGRLLEASPFALFSGTTMYEGALHGTHVAGTIAGGTVDNVELGVAPEAKLVVYRLIDNVDGGAVSSLIETMAALDFIADPDKNPLTMDQPRVVNNSWGMPFPKEKEGRLLLYAAYCPAMESLVDLGILPVFSAGNDGEFGPETIGFPGACPEVFTVGAISSKGQLAPFSSIGPVEIPQVGKFLKPDVVAPGVKVASTVPMGQFAELDGTSMASPHVTGAAALLFQANPNLTVRQAADILRKTAIDLGPKGPDTGFGYGAINVPSAVQLALTVH